MIITLVIIIAIFAASPTLDCPGVCFLHLRHLEVCVVVWLLTLSVGTPNSDHKI